jgi:hypothetical protein
LQGISRPNWALHVARHWSQRRAAKVAVSLVLDAIGSSGDDGADDNDFVEAVAKAFDSIAVANLSLEPHPTGECFQPDDLTAVLGDKADEDADPRKRMYRLYLSRESLVHSLRDGVEPLSLVVFVDRSEERSEEAVPTTQQYGMAYRDAKQTTRLLSVRPVLFVTERCGASFFRWEEVAKEHLSLEDDPTLDAVCVVDYGLLLPLSADFTNTDNEQICLTVYYFITYWWMELQANGRLALYRPQPT